MKKIIASLALLVGMVANADYLYWMVNTDDAASYKPYTTVKLSVVGGGVIDEYTFGSATELETYKNSGYYFTATGEFSSSQSYFVELYNGSTWVAQSSSVSYSTLLNAGSIFNPNSITPASVTATYFGSYAIPEPTSGLLFLLGGVLLGLKRRRQV